MGEPAQAIIVDPPSPDGVSLSSSLVHSVAPPNEHRNLSNQQNREIHVSQVRPSYMRISQTRTFLHKVIHVLEAGNKVIKIFPAVLSCEILLPLKCDKIRQN